MDKLELCGLGDCSGIFQSRHAYKKVQLAKLKFSVYNSKILPIANYVDETRRSDIKDILALQAILNTLHEAVTYIENITKESLLRRKYLIKFSLILHIRYVTLIRKIFF